MNEAGNAVSSCAVSVRKQDARAFERWLHEASPPWPDDLKKLGRFAMLALDTLDVPTPHEKIVREAAKDMAAFLEAYAAHRP